MVEMWITTNEATTVLKQNFKASCLTDEKPPPISLEEEKNNSRNNNFGIPFREETLFCTIEVKKHDGRYYCHTKNISTAIRTSELRVIQSIMIGPEAINIVINQKVDCYIEFESLRVFLEKYNVLATFISRTFL